MYFNSPMLRSYVFKAARRLFKRFESTGKPPLCITESVGSMDYFTPQPDTIFRSRYQFSRELGRGIHSTVWLAKDLKLDDFVAVKILTTEVTAFQGQIAFEHDILKDIQSRLQSSRHEGRMHVLSLLDDFYETGSHGRHLFLVTELLRNTLKSYQAQADKCSLPPAFVKSVTRQVLSALDFLHDECKVVHTDIKQDNIQFADDGSSSRVLVPNKKDGSTSTGAAHDLPNIFTIELIDFGTAEPAYGAHDRLIQPAALRAPEVILGCKWGASADVWNFGCIIFELLTGRCLFNPKSGPDFSAEVYHLGHVPGVVGHEFAPYVAFFKSGKNFDMYLNDDGTLIRQVFPVKSLEEILHFYGVFDPLLLDFLLSMLHIFPDQRKSAKQLLKHPWLV